MGIAGGQVIGLVVAVLPLLIINRSILSNVRFVGWSDIRRVLSKFKSFPLYGAPQSLLQAATFSMPVLIIGSLFGTVEAAIFWLGFRVFGLPSQVVIESVRASLLSNFSQKIRERRGIVQLWKRSSVALGALMLPLPLILALFGHRLFGFVFGDEWTSASTVTMILSFAWIAQNARVPSVVVLQLTGNQKLQLSFEVAGTVGRALALSSALLMQSFYTVLSLFVIVNLLQSVVTISMTLVLLRSFEEGAELTRSLELLRNKK
jgi:O-antigen/teichoic acid export membrane protein